MSTGQRSTTKLSPGAKTGKPKPPTKTPAKKTPSRTTTSSSRRTTPARRKPAAKPVPVVQSKKRSTVAVVFAAIADLLALVALTLGLFLLWQNWWTNIVGERAQAEIVNNLEWAPQPIPVAPIIVTPAEQDPPILPDPLEEDTFGILYIPRLGDDYVRPINEGVDRSTVLDVLGIGHYPKTALPGDVGNFAIAGHRTTYGKPFADINKLQPGDPIIVRTENGWFIYRVKTTVIVNPTDVNVIYPILAGLPGNWEADQYISLTTCHPPGSAGKRLVVIGTLDYWSPDTDHYPAELLPEDI